MIVEALVDRSGWPGSARRDHQPMVPMAPSSQYEPARSRLLWMTVSSGRKGDERKAVHADEQGRIRMSTVVNETRSVIQMSLQYRVAPAVSVGREHSFGNAVRGSHGVTSPILPVRGEGIRPTLWRCPLLDIGSLGMARSPTIET